MYHSDTKTRYRERDVSETVEALERLVLENQLEEALDFLEALPQSERQHWQIQNLTGIICSYCGRYPQALTFFQAALEQRPDDPEALYNLADTYAALGMRRQALAMLNRCEQQPNAAELAGDLAALRDQLARQNGGRVLMAAYYFPPLSGSGVFRSLKFAKYLPQFGWEPTVLSTDQPPNGWNFADESQVAEIPEDMKVIRIPDLIGTGRDTTLSGERVRALLGFLRDVLRFSPEADRIFERLTQTKAGITKLLTFPCTALSWAYDTVQFIEKYIDLDPFELIYTTSGPASAHLIGFYFKQKYGVPWVADYRDPWTFNPYKDDYDPSDPQQRMLFELESVLLRQADNNLIVDEMLLPNYRKNFSLPADKITCIANGYDEADFAALETPKGRSERFTMIHNGLLYSEQRSMESIFAALRQLADEGKINLSKIRFRLVGVDAAGNLDFAKQYGLSQIVDCTGYCSHRQALAENQNADLLLLPVGDAPKVRTVATGKLYEYLRSGRSILALAPKNGFVDRILRETRQGKAFVSSQLSAIKAMILREYKTWERGDRTVARYSPAIRRFERKALTEQLAQTLESVLFTTQKPLELSSEVYDDVYQSGGCDGNYHKHYTQSFYYSSWKYALSMLADVKRSASVLEIGCGAGQFANMLFDNGFSNYTGFDYTEKAVALARENNPRYRDRFFAADAFHTELMTQKYDLVICFEVLEHVQKDLDLLRRIQPGTRLLLSVPNFDDPYHVRYFSGENEVRQRYRQVMKIFEIHISRLTETNCLYYILGEKE